MARTKRNVKTRSAKAAPSHPGPTVEEAAISRALDGEARALDRIARPARGKAKGKTVPCNPQAGERRECGAKTRAGGRCRAPAVTGSNRCRLHGGNNPGAPEGNRRALKHGIYSRSLLPDEAEIFDAIEIGSIDTEIKIARLQLRRALIAQSRFDVMSTDRGVPAPDDLEIAEIASTGAGAKREVTIKRVKRDYGRPIRSLLKLVGDLELRRATLLTMDKVGESADELATKLRQLFAEMDEADGINKPFPAENAPSAVSVDVKVRST